MSDGAVLRVFLDQCVPDSAGKAFAEHGHEVMYLRDMIATDSSDPFVASIAKANAAILVSLDPDFRKILQRHGIGARQLRRLSLIKLSCRESRCYQRITDAMSLILHEWDVVRQGRVSRMFIDIGEKVIRTSR